MATVTEDQWAAEILRLSAKQAEGLSTQEWADKLGRGPRYVQALLRKAKQMGWLETGQKTLEAIDGRAYPATVYRIVRPAGRTTPKKEKGNG